MKKNFLKIVAFVATTLNLELNSKEKIELSDEQKEQLDKDVNIQGFAEKFVEKYNADIASSENKEAMDMIQTFMEAQNQETETGDSNGQANANGAENGAENAETEQADKSLKGMIQTLISQNSKLVAQNEKLKADPEGDDAVQTLKRENVNMPILTHSKTHLFGKDASWNQFEGRPWNKSVRDGVVSATDWTDVNISKINEDLGAYARKNPEKIMSLLMDGLSIPDHWEVVSGVTDEYVFVSVTTGEITQGFKSQWLPKNNQKFEPIKNKIFDIQIDATWTVKQLKAIERNYLQRFFKATSSPYKEDFVAFLTEELIKKARKEDKIALFKGVYYETPETATTPGRFINKMDGMLKVISRYRGKAYKAHELGALTEENIYDKINKWVKDLPYDFRELPGLVIGTSTYWHKAYHDGRERAKGTNNDYQPNESFVEKYSNIRFAPHPQLEGQDFIYITTEDNLGVMWNQPGEEGMITMEKRKRNIDAYADYKFGFFIKALGATDADGNAAGYDDQIFFSNEAEVLQDVYVPAAGNDATPSVKEHNALIIGAQNTAATDITAIDDVTEGQYIYLYGDSDVNPSTVKKNANILLDAGDFQLGKGDLLVLRALAGNKVIEISRTEAGEEPSVEFVPLADGATTADALNGNNFVTVENTAATAFTNIENAVKGEKYTLKGGSSTNATTIANGGNFHLSAAMTLNLDAYIVLEYNGQKFVEYARG